MSLGELRAAMAAFHPRTQLALRARFVEPFFRGLPALIEVKDGDFLDDYMKFMLPVLCTPAGVENSDA